MSISCSKESLTKPKSIALNSKWSFNQSFPIPHLIPRKNTNTKK